MYLIEILHQTTTDANFVYTVGALYLIEILHQTTTQSTIDRNTAGCILSKFYIKPQLQMRFFDDFTVVSYRNSTSNHNRQRRHHDHDQVVSYRNSTSNHNLAGVLNVLLALYLIEILHQTTTGNRIVPIFDSCILSKFYIKPQLRLAFFF